MRKKLLSLLMLLCIGFGSWAQNKTVTGKVFDSRDGKPLSGVTVKVKGTALAATTNASGEFQITIPGARATLEVSYVGFESKSYTVSGGEVNINLDVKTNSLNEVFVVGYGTKIKRDITGSVAK